MIYSYLQKYKKTKITLEELYRCFNDINTYDDFYQQIKNLVNENVLSPIKGSGNNGYGKPLANKYRISRQVLKEQLAKTINSKILNTHSLISLDSYFGLPIEEFEKDEPYINKIDDYVRRNGLPKDKLLPELSFELTGNEKWIENGNGKLVLIRLGLWEQLTIVKKPDPVAYAVNKRIIDRRVHRHLIVENKTPFIHAMEVIDKSDFNTVIYGQGWKITSGLDMFFKQYSFGEVQELYYFGDIDKAGISIYMTIKDKYSVLLAKEFYKALFDLGCSEGKTNQSCSSDTILSFIECLKENNSDKSPVYIEQMLSKGCYQPQEMLSKSMIERIMELDENRGNKYD